MFPDSDKYEGGSGITRNTGIRDGHSKRVCDRKTCIREMHRNREFDRKNGIGIRHRDRGFDRKAELETGISADNSIGQTELDIDAEDSIETPVFVEETHQINEREELEGDVANVQIDPGCVDPSLSSLPGVLSDTQSNLPTYVFVSIFGHPVRALVDSGASIIMISTELMENIPELQNEILTPAHYENMRSIDGSLIP